MLKSKFPSLFLSLTIFFSTEGVLLVSLIVGGCGAPELPVCATVWSARVVDLLHEDERERTRLAIRITSIDLFLGLYMNKIGMSLKMFIRAHAEQLVPVNDRLMIVNVELFGLWIRAVKLM